MIALPEPARTRGLGHLARWTFDPLGLMSEGARSGHVFGVQLWRPMTVGYRPDWNRAILSDLDTFRSGGSLSDITPYLSAGVVHADEPDHDSRRQGLNPTFHSRALGPLTDRLREVVDREAATGEFDALAWSSRVVRRMLNAAFFAGAFPDDLLAAFLAPLQRPVPAPLLPRPLLFRRVDRAIAAALRDPVPDTLAAALAAHPGADEEIRVALAAGYDTTAHTLAWALWHLAGEPRWRTAQGLRPVLDETLRLYPAGWIGTRIAARDTTAAGVAVPAGRLVAYSPYLTHRDPELWPDPTRFDPGRFADARPAWGYLPFSAGRRTCLGVHLARAMLTTALTAYLGGTLTQVAGDPSVRTAIALRPAGPLVVASRPSPQRHGQCRARHPGEIAGGQWSVSRTGR